jgi:pyridoxal phosphate enzyme (YggS family)
MTQSTDNYSATAAEQAISDNLYGVHQQISACSLAYGRDPDTVKLLAVSKTKPLHDIEVALAAGQADLGENYLQEALEKIQSLAASKDQHPDWNPVWHYIGAIQSNKTRPIAEHFDWVHTVASSKVASRLSSQRPANLAPLNVLIQVNIDAEDSKAGVSAEALLPLIEAIMPLPNLVLRGLMAIPSTAQDLDTQRRPFKQLRELLLQARQTYGEDLAAFDQLSMGMSGDMEAAIAEGSTWVRIGTSIFGARPSQG